VTPKEQSLQRQLGQAQAAIPQFQLEALQANTQRDQAEATLRIAQAMVTTLTTSYANFLDYVATETDLAAIRARAAERGGLPGSGSVNPIP
jgi:hypothetical protein